MATVPMRVRLDPLTDAALRKRARDRDMPIATLARDLIRAGLAADAPDEVHPLIAVTAELLDWEPGSDVERVQFEEIEQYARLAAAGSLAAVQRWSVLLEHKLREVDQ